MRLAFTLSDSTITDNSTNLSLDVTEFHWEIPWNVGLPDKSGLYLVTNRDGTVGLASYYIDDDSGNLLKLRWEKDIIAWSFLPEPYKII